MNTGLTALETPSTLSAGAVKSHRPLFPLERMVSSLLPVLTSLPPTLRPPPWVWLPSACVGCACLESLMFSSQFFPPEYSLIVSEVCGETRFSAAVAKRLESLGALTQACKAYLFALILFRRNTSCTARSLDLFLSCSNVTVNSRNTHYSLDFSRFRFRFRFRFASAFASVSWLENIDSCLFPL